jgi:hypothetical protein
MPASVPNREGVDEVLQALLLSLPVQVLRYGLNVTDASSSVLAIAYRQRVLKGAPAARHHTATEQ